MKKKILILIGMVFLLTGCTTEYNVFIDDDSIKEEIVMTIDQQEIADREESDLDDQLTPLIKEAQSPFEDERDFYEKKVAESNDKTLVKLTYKYTYDEFTQSKSYQCFDKHKISNVDGALDIEFSGGFDCLIGDSVNINIFTDKTVYETNADKIDGNKYTWHINDNNRDNINIILKTDENKKHSNDLLLMFMMSFITIFFVLTIILYIQYNKKVLLVKK